MVPVLQSDIYSKVILLGSAVMKWFLTAISIVLGSVSLPGAVAHEGAGYAQDAIIAIENGELYEALAARVLPKNAALIHEPVSIDFGADRQGILLIFATNQPVRQYHIWYLAKQQTPPVYHKIVVKAPEAMDEFFDLQVNKIFTVGPEGAKDLVLLEQFSRPVIAGGEVHLGGSVYRRRHLGAEYLEQASQALDGVRLESQARKKVKPWVAKIPQPKPGSLIEEFLNLPVTYLNATKLERWMLVKPGSPRILVRDLPNGYVQIAGDGGLPGYIFVRFKTEDRGSVFALQTIFPVGQKTLFLKYQENHWIDVSHAIVPHYSADQHYILPNIGTDLVVSDPDKRAKTVYHWNRQRFVSKTSEHVQQQNNKR
jgi:hypothetical protein